MAKQMAREKMGSYEKHMLESDLERVKLSDTFAKCEQVFFLFS